MATLSWGKPKIEICAYVAGVMPASPTWTVMPLSRQDSTKLTTVKGTKTEMKGEGGELIDVRFDINSYTLETEIPFQKGATRPITDTDGKVAVNYAVRLTPEDDTLEGFIIDKASVQVEETFNAKDGKMLKYTFEALKPATGNLLKPYTKP